MGTGASEYFTTNGVNARIEIVPGGFDSDIYKPAQTNKQYDLILVGRLSKVKRVEVFLDAISNLHKEQMAATAVIVGDGPDASMLKDKAKSLGILDSVHFAGWQNNVHEWMAKSRIFALTSESEGLSQALIQGMMSGLPAVVTDIGDLSDLVMDGVNGYLIEDLDPDKFSHAYGKLLRDDKLYAAMSERAFQDTRKYSYYRVSQQWDDILRAIDMKS
jgi:glycosyltransferase involved in cell wall biosynthesis